MQRVKKVGVTSGALIVIILLLGIASTSDSFLGKRTGQQIIEAWEPIPGLFGTQQIVSVGQAGTLPGVYELPMQTEVQKALMPNDIQFYVQGIFTPSTMYGEIQLYDDIIRTYEGKFGPYPYDPVENLVIKMCAQNQYESDPPTCEQIITTAFIEGYVVFGYANKYDEYIGYYPRDKYTAFFEIYTKDGEFLSKSNVAKVRLVRNIATN